MMTKSDNSLVSKQKPYNEPGRSYYLSMRAAF